MKAEYRIQIPTSDELGRPLHRHLPMAAHQWLHDSHPRLFEQTWIEGPHQNAAGAHHHLHTIADESPESDSYVKQLAAHLGEAAGVPSVAASKHGKNGLESWMIANRKYVPGQGAQPEALEPPEEVFVPVAPAFR